MSIIPSLPTSPAAPNIFDQHSIVSGSSETVSADTTWYWNGANTAYEVAGSLTNAGTLWLASTNGGTTVSLVSGGTVSNSGDLIAQTSTGNAVAIGAPGGSVSGTIVTSGDVWALASAGNAYGVWTSPANEAVQNSGTIAAQAFSDPSNPNDPHGPMTSGMAFGIYADGSGVPISNGPGGQVLAEGDLAIGIWSRGSAPGASYPYEINNQGTIEAVSTTANSPSYGLLLADTSGQLMRVMNSGTIEADVAISAPSEGFVTGFSSIQYGSESITNAASGIIHGGIDLYNGDDILVNQGQISGGWVDMGPGNDTLDTSSGTLSGLVYMGLGNDSFLGSSGNDLVTGEGGDDNLQGNAGDDLLLGGTGNDTLIGGSGNDGLYGEFGNDRLVQQAGDSIFGGDGNDRIELSDYSFTLVDGGTGYDTLVLPSGSRLIDLSAVAGSNRVTNIDEIDLNGSKEMVIRSSDVAAITGGGTQLVIGASASDKVDLIGTWSIAGQQTIGGISFTSYTSGGAAVLVQQGATVVTGPAAPAGALGLDAIASGAAPPAPGDSTGLYADQGLTALWDPYQIDGTQVRVESYETWNDFVGRAVFTSSSLVDESTSIANFGQISSSGNDLVSQAISLARGTVSNSGTISADNSGTGSAQSILISTSGTISNNGEIEATAAVGDAVAIETSDVRSGASVTNGAGGRIDASAAAGIATGISAASDGVQIVNHGAIDVSGVAGATGVSFGSSGGTLVNDGSIQASTSGGPSSVGVSAAGESTLINSGTISADVAVLYQMHLGLGFSLNNSGTINGAINIQPYDPSSTYGYVQLNNSGQIVGSISVAPSSSGTVSIANSGKIIGNVTLGAGNDIYDGHAGTLTGTVNGGSGNDTLTGGSGDDIFTGGSGHDTLTGGAGADTFLDTAAGLSGDTITDFSAGDKILISDATLTGFSFSLSGHTLTYSGGTLTLSSVPAGHIVASAAAGGGVELTLQPEVANDFNGDGRSDVLWRNSNGDLTDWLGQSNGSFVGNTDYAWNNASTSWHIAGTGDFNGDGHADILWQSDTGEVTDWLGNGNGGFAGNIANADNHVDAGWQVAGTGDVNGDGRADVIWRNTATGTLTDWLGQSNGSFAGNTDYAWNNASTSWHIVATGDFNGDGHADLLWQSDTGEVTDWLGNGNGGFSGNIANADNHVDAGWQVAGTGDVNGDGRDDIIWRNTTTGTLTDWLGQSNGSFAGNTDYAWNNASTSWHIVQVGDFNGDGHADILWQSDTGEVTNWLGNANGGFNGNIANADNHVDAGWHVMPHTGLI